jgi:glycosidase
MNKEAILHIPLSEYAYATDERHLIIRIRCKRDDMKQCKLYYGDRACRLTPVIFSEVEMKLVARTELFDYFEAEIEDAYKRLCYYFWLDDGKEQILYYGDYFANEIVSDRSEYYQFPFNHRADVVSPPEWAKHAVIYNIFPDSFATSEKNISLQPVSKQFGEHTVYGKLGGSIKGIKDNVQYLKELGVNAIYMNPIFAAGEYHKYDLIDYYQVDPCFGSNEDLKDLVKTFHQEGIRVIIDGVFNHCGWKFFAFEDVVLNGEASKYKDWFYGLTFPVIRPEDPETYPNYECFGYERLMPKLNTANPEVEEYFCKVGKYWIEEFQIDGWRLDVASEVNDEFWRKFYREIKKSNPDSILIGEVWESANHWLDGTIFDSAMNYDFRKHCKRFFAEQSIDAMEFDSRVTNMRMRYRKQTCFSQLNVLDSHDVSRFLSLCEEDRERYQLAIVFQLTFPGMPSIFYGNEKGIVGVMEDDYRAPMPWEKDDTLFPFFQALIKLRMEHEVMREGEYRTISADKGSYLYVFERYLADQKIRVFLNMASTKENIEKLIPQGDVLLSKGYQENNLKEKGFLIVKCI